MYLLRKIIIFIFFTLKYADGRGANGGFSCATCTVVFGLSGQLADFHNETLLDASLRLCHMLPGRAQEICERAVRTIEPALTNPDLTKLFTPDLFCYGVGICYASPGHNYCHLFPKPASNFRNTVQDTKNTILSSFMRSITDVDNAHQVLLKSAYEICSLPGIQQICRAFARSFFKLQPALDVDGDLFSIVESARGSHWRGRDCRDWDSESYPGRKPRDGDERADHNCNGIWGTNPDTGRTYESELCSNSGSQGVIYIGDSVGAHFHFPQVWINPLLFSPETLHNCTQPLLDELDWPHMGFATGYTNTTQPLLIQGVTDSVYLRLRARNRCNHRDYQNLSRNGASSFDVLDYLNSLARNQSHDKPALAFYSMFGNDVCNRFADSVPHMTSPQAFRTNVMQVLKFLDSVLPQGSHIVLVGLVDGGFIYPTMADRRHPLGQLGNKIYYRDVYRWFSCMEMGPCAGWMSSNATLRKETSKMSHTLSAILQEVVAAETFSSFDMHYLDNPLHQVLWEWQKEGRPLWQLLDAVDSLHPSQAAQPLIADVLWRNMKDKFPHVVGSINPNNARIQELFGDQGGH